MDGRQPGFDLPVIFTTEVQMYLKSYMQLVEHMTKYWSDEVELTCTNNYRRPVAVAMAFNTV